MSDVLDRPASPRDADWVWARMRQEAACLAREDSLLASFFHAAVLNHAGLASALSHDLAGRLASREVPAMLLRQVCDQAYRAQPHLVEFAARDVCAHVDRDPACDHYVTPLLYFKGFHAIQAFRVANWLWHEGRRGLACFWQGRVATELDVDIHPAASLGSGIMLDHATGLVIGETAIVGDDVSLLHGVTLGGCGLGEGPRHPRIGNGVMISTGARLLGAIVVGEGARIAAGSVVMQDVPASVTVAGVPAREVSRRAGQRAALDMDQSVGNDPARNHV